MEVKTILTILVLNILLPTADVFTDINLVVKLYNSPPDCVNYPSYGGDENRRIYLECLQDPLTFCSHPENGEHCFSHYKMATLLLVPFILNYIVCFYTFFRLTTNRKKYLFFFPLLNLYPQYGIDHLILN